MNRFAQSSDATMVYRETSSTNVLRLDGTANAGSLLDFMRDSKIRIGAPSPHLQSDKERALLSPLGSIDAVA